MVKDELKTQLALLLGLSFMIGMFSSTADSISSYWDKPRIMVIILVIILLIIIHYILIRKTLPLINSLEE